MTCSLNCYRKLNGHQKYQQIGGVGVAGFADNFARGMRGAPDALAKGVDLQRLRKGSSQLASSRRLVDDLYMELASATGRRAKNSLKTRIKNLQNNIVKQAADLNRLKREAADLSGGAFDPDVFLKQMDEGAENLKKSVVEQLQSRGVTKGLTDNVMKQIGIDPGDLPPNLTKSLGKEVDEAAAKMVDDIISKKLDEVVNNPTFAQGLNSANEQVRKLAQDMVSKTVNDLSQLAVPRMLKEGSQEMVGALKNRIKHAAVVAGETKAMMRRVTNLGDDVAQSARKASSVTDEALDKKLTQAFKEVGEDGAEYSFREAQEIGGFLVQLRKQFGVQDMDQALRVINDLGDEALGGVVGRIRKKFGTPNKVNGKQLRKFSIDEYIDVIGKDVGNKKLLRDNLSQFADIPVSNKLKKTIKESIDKSVAEGSGAVSKKWKRIAISLGILSAIAIIITAVTINDDGFNWDEEQEESAEDLAAILSKLLDMEKKGEAPDGTAEEYLYRTYEAMLAEGDVDPALEAIIQCLDSGADMDLTPFAEGSRDFEGFAKDLDLYGCAAYVDPNSDFLPYGMTNDDADDIWGMLGDEGGGGTGGDEIGFTTNMFSSEWITKYWWVLLIIGIVILMIIGLVIFLMMSGGEGEGGN